METRRLAVWAVSVMGIVLAEVTGPSLGRTQEPLLPPPFPEEPVLESPPTTEPGGQAEEGLQVVEEEATVGPTPGAPTVDLARAVTLALERNFGMLAAADGLRVARFNESTALAQFYPRLTPGYVRSSTESSVSLDGLQRLPFTGGSVSAATALRRSTPGDLVAASRSTDLRLVLSQPLLRGFGPNATFFELRNSRRARRGQERSFELARQRLAVEVTRAFYQIVKQRQLLEVARQSLKRSESLRRASQARMSVGLASRLDVLRAELQASQAQEAMVSSQAALEGGLEQFRFLMGLPPEDPVEPEAVMLPDQLDSGSEPLDVLLQRAFENRLELQESRDLVDDGRRTLALARQRLLPQLDVNLSLTQTGFGPNLSDTFRGADRRLDFFFTTSYPLERSADRAGKAIAELDLTARSRSLRQKELEIESDVRAAVRELERIRKSVELQRKGLDFAAQQHRLATLRYQRGLASNFDVVDAEGNLVLARTAVVGLLTDYQVARVQLLRATGALDVTQEFAP